MFVPLLLSLWNKEESSVLLQLHKDQPLTLKKGLSTGSIIDSSGDAWYSDV